MTFGVIVARKEVQVIHSSLHEVSLIKILRPKLLLRAPPLVCVSVPDEQVGTL